MPVLFLRVLFLPVLFLPVLFLLSACVRTPTPTEDCLARQLRLHLPPALANTSAPTSLKHWKTLAEGKAMDDCGMPRPALKLLDSISTESASSIDARIRSTSIRWTLGLSSPNEAVLEELSTVVDINHRRDLRPALLALHAQWHRGSGRAADFQATVRALRKEFPTHPLSTSLRAESTVPEGLEALATELDALRAEGRTAEALRLLQQSTILRKAPAEKYAEFAMLEIELLKLSGEAHRADKLLRELTQSRNAELAGKAVIAQALVLWNKGDASQALQLLEQLSTKSSSRPQADYLRGRIYEESHAVASAVSAYKRVPSGSEWHEKALRQLAWISIRAKEPAEAKRRLQALAVNSAVSSFSVQAHFWNASLYESAKSRRELAVSHPLDEYSILLGASPLLALAQSDSSTDCYAPPPDALLQALQYLHGADLESYARHEVHYFLFQTAGQETSVADEALRAELLASVGAYTSALRSAHRALNRFGWDRSPQAPEVAGCLRILLAQLYPLPFLERYQAAEKQSGVPLSLLYAISRTESHFDPKAVSNRGAIGLMQLLPSTATEEGLAPDEELVDPAVNIRLGAKHLARLAQEFIDEAPQIAAYNAGAAAVRRWQQRFPRLRGLMWAEHLGYEETKNYVRKVLAAKKIYQLLLEPEARSSAMRHSLDTEAHAHLMSSAKIPAR